MTDNRPITTTDAGIPAPSDHDSQSIGPDGPLLLQDHYLIQKMAQFNRERVPERVVHAKGGGAFGFLEMTEDVSQFTKAKVFAKGKRTELLLRFSSVAGDLEQACDSGHCAVDLLAEHVDSQYARGFLQTFEKELSSVGPNAAAHDFKDYARSRLSA